jgi:hypothetical protein
MLDSPQSGLCLRNLISTSSLPHHGAISQPGVAFQVRYWRSATRERVAKHRFQFFDQCGTLGWPVGLYKMARTPISRSDKQPNLRWSFAFREESPPELLVEKYQSRARHVRNHSRSHRADGPDHRSGHRRTALRTHIIPTTASSARTPACSPTIARRGPFLLLRDFKPDW